VLTKSIGSASFANRNRDQKKAPGTAATVAEGVDSKELAGHFLNGPYNIAAELRKLAKDVRRIPAADRMNPETVFMAKDQVEKRLLALARRVEVAA
jgi:hypothetical protein